MIEFFEQNVCAFIVTGTVSLVALVAAAVGTAIVVVRLPADYFVRSRRPDWRVRVEHPVTRWILIGLKNLLGVIFLLSGLLMLLTPGQGVLTILIGLSLMNFPGKYRVIRWIVSRGPVFQSANWLRRKAHKEPLRRPDVNHRHL